MEVFIVSVLILVILSFIWFLITGILLLITGKDYSIGDLFEYFRRKAAYRIDQDEFEKILNLRFRYYHELSQDLRPRFLQRVIDFVGHKTFVPTHDILLTTEHKVLIAAAAVQLTFGLDKYLLEYFRSVIIYPREYYSAAGNAYHKGEVNARGAIVLSMEDFFFGYNSEEDGINLGIHEMAHALQLDYFLQQDYEDFFGAYYVKWQQEAEKERRSVGDQGDELLRNYAFANPVEFFSVCAENFFERPKLFREKKPELYQRLSILLNQDPAEKYSMIKSPRSRHSEEPLFAKDPGKLLYRSAFPFKSEIIYYGSKLILLLTFCAFSRSLLIILGGFGLVAIIVFLRLLSYKRLELYEHELRFHPLLFPTVNTMSFLYTRLIFVEFSLN